MHLHISLKRKSYFYKKKKNNESIFVKMISKIDEGLGHVWLPFFFKLFYIIKNKVNTMLGLYIPKAI